MNPQTASQKLVDAGFQFLLTCLRMLVIALFAGAFQMAHAATRLFVSEYGTGNVRAFDPATGASIALPAHYSPVGGNLSGADGMVLDPDGRLLVNRGDGTISRRSADGNSFAPFAATGAEYLLDAARTATHLFAAQYGERAIWRIALSNAAVSSIAGPPAANRFDGVRIGPDGRLYAVDSQNGNLFVYHLGTSTWTTFLANPLAGDASQMEFGADGRVFLSRTIGGQARLYSYTLNTPGDYASGLNPSSQTLIGGYGSFGAATGIRIGPDGRLYANAFNAGEVWRSNVGITAMEASAFITGLQEPGSLFFESDAGAATLALSPTSVALPGRATAGRTFGVKALQAWTATADQPWIVIAGGGFGTGNGTVTYDVQANAGGARAGTITVSLGGLARTFTVNQWPAATMPGVSADGDFDGDGGADLATFNPTSAIWRVWFRTGAQWTLQWGSAGMVPVPADYDGDGAVDLGIYTPASGNWSILQSGNGQLLRRAWGAPTLVPVPGDYNSDGQMDIAAFNRASGQWFAALTGGGSRTAKLGWSSTVPVPADYDGDGKADLAMFNPASGLWDILASAAGGYAAQWGWPGVVPVPADYDGDGAVDLGIYTPASGNWSVLQSGNGQLLRRVWGAPALVPVPGDYNGDGQMDVAAFSRKTGQWFVALTGGGSRTAKLGWATTVPVPADYDGDGQTDFAVYNRGSRTWFIIESSTGGLVKRPWGEPGDVPAQLTPQIHSRFRLP